MQEGSKKLGLPGVFLSSAQHANNPVPYNVFINTNIFSQSALAATMLASIVTMLIAMLAETIPLAVTLPLGAISLCFDLFYLTVVSFPLPRWPTLDGTSSRGQPAC